MQSTKEKASTTVIKEKGKEKERTKAKATEDTTATDTTVTTSTTKEKESMEEKDSIAITTVRSASAIHSEEATKETKDSAKDTTREKERTKENKQQIHATDVEEQDTMPKTAEWQYTTLDKEKAMTLRTRQHNGTTTPGWRFQDYTRQQQGQQPLALPPIAPTSNHDMTPIHVTAMISNGNDHKTDTTSSGTTDTMHIMIDSGSATHVCPLWFADNYPVYKIDQAQSPNLRTVTNKTIHNQEDNQLSYPSTCVTSMTQSCQ